jgi:phosphatidylglycerophosphate synthase
MGCHDLPAFPQKARKGSRKMLRIWLPEAWRMGSAARVMDEESRRPLKSRSTAWAAALSGWLARRGVAPNAISAASLVFALVSGAAFAATASPVFQNALVPLWLAAAAGIQLRLLCNLMDGMVAVEGGRKSSGGELWNELPDRLADLAILVGAGFAGGSALLGAVAACGAVGTAYLRAFGASLTGRQDFRGPMAKPQRMAVLTVAAIAAACAPVAGVSGSLIMHLTLWIVVAGIVVTCFRRITRLARALG